MNRLTLLLLTINLGVMSQAFAADTVSLDVTVLGSGSVTSSPSGIDCPDFCSADFSKRAKITLTAVPESGAEFLGWGGSCEGTNPVCNVRTNKYRNVTAEFGHGLPPSPVPQTGLTVCIGDDQGSGDPIPVPCDGSGEDAETQAGIVWPDPRFVDNGDGTVRDNLTGIVWLQNANCFALVTWTEAMQLAGSIGHGDCGLIDSSLPGDWRLPNIRELLSIVDYGIYQDTNNSPPALPSGHPFINVKTNGTRYWSSTSQTRANNSFTANCVNYGVRNRARMYKELSTVCLVYS